MLIKGEKYACEACIRGHRVSTCQHHERPLSHINKKGRPVSQCPHCRGLRKARSTHVQCECGQKPHNKTECNPIDRHDPKSWQGGDAGADYSHEQHHSCCCSHGSRCTCALKKEHLDTVPEVDVPESSPVSNADMRKPRLVTTPSESTLTVFTNGHHKPVHKHNDMAHKCGAPYKIPRSHTIHGHSELAQRSVDSLPLTKRALLSHEGHPHHESVTSAPQPVRRVKSEHGSPEIKPLFNLEPLNTSVPLLDPTGSPFDSGSPVMLPFGYERFPENYLASLETEPSLNSAGLNAPSVDWSTFGNFYDNPGFGESSQPPSYASFDHSNLGHPGLTTSSSGDISEVEDFCPIPAPRQISQDSADASSIGEWSEDKSYRLSSASSYMALPQAGMLASSKLESLDIDNFLKSAEAQTTALQQINTPTSVDSGQSYMQQPELDVSLSHPLGQINEISVNDGPDAGTSDNQYSDPLFSPSYESCPTETDPHPLAVWSS